MESKIEHINPNGLFKSPSFSQIVTTKGNGKTIYIGGQNAVNDNHELIGKNEIAQQTDQIMKNLEIALKACKANFKHLIKLNIYVLQGQDAKIGFQISQKYLGQSTKQPIITVVFVAGLVHPDFLVEIDGIAFIPEE
ncbi:RidA family protein [Winogradskyella alexanderae]|uniref:RidA family protein n=1 Tax=Winogradskyella alexanderae TaxID=2877123 RepID=A0ABS7XY14_9FLAO|nr:Rid family hydrolase [Winogradskyella alexanderae]MCA0133706.1 RidA family protein [Winogradskyella alexanderae]